MREKILTIILILILTLLVGLGGNLDHDEYIEANLTPVTRLP